MMAEKAPQTYSSLDLELIPTLSRMDPILGNIIKGINTTLNDADNPDKFYQAANSIRGLTDILIRSARYKLKKNLSKKALNKKQKYVLKKLNNSFDKTIKYIPDEHEEKKACESFLSKQFSSLNETIENAFRCLPITTKHILRSYFGDHEEIDTLPKPVKERIKKAIILWHENHGYFVGVSHYPDDPIESSEFITKWEGIQRCLLSVLKQFYENADTLDQILKLDEPPND